MGHLHYEMATNFSVMSQSTTIPGQFPMQQFHVHVDLPVCKQNRKLIPHREY